MLLELGCKDMCIIPAKINELEVGLEYRNKYNTTPDRIEKLVLAIGTAKADRILDIIRTGSATSDMADHFVYSDHGSCTKVKCPLPSSGIILTGDQVVTCGGQIYEKPVDAAEAKQFYQDYSDGSCSTVGSVVLTDIETKCSVSAVDITTLHFNSIPEEVIDSIVSNNPPREENDVIMYCCGALMSEHTVLSAYIRQIDGDIDAVLGLRKATVIDLLAKLETKIAAH